MNKTMSNVAIILLVAVGLFLLMAGSYLSGGALLLGGFILYKRNSGLSKPNSGESASDQDAQPGIVEKNLAFWIFGISPSALGKSQILDWVNKDVPIENRDNQNGRKFWFEWILANLLGGIIGAIIGSLLYLPVVFFVFLTIRQAMDAEPYGQIVLNVSLTLITIVSGGVAGAALGGAQWLVLRQKLSRGGRWLLVSSIGGPIGLILISPVLSGESSLTKSIAIVFSVIGLMQWFVLRRQVARSGWWVLANLISGILGGFTFSMAVPIIFGTINGLTLIWLFRQPVLEEQPL